MITFPKAKINIGLRVTGKRPDGFHDIETLFYPVALADALEFVVPPFRVTEDELTVTGIAIKIRSENNLVIRAVRKLREKYPIPLLRIHLHKVIPAGAGLGGGSSDAAFMLKALDKCFNLSLSCDELREYALALGSDCPFFIDAVPSLAAGRGEILTPCSPILEGRHIVLLNPGISIITSDAYHNTTPSGQRKRLAQLVKKEIPEWKKHIRNDFEDYAFKLYPQILDIKKSLYRSGALYASMSGSGSSVYGIFEGKPEIENRFRPFIIHEGIL